MLGEEIHNDTANYATLHTIEPHALLGIESYGYPTCFLSNQDAQEGTAILRKSQGIATLNPNYCQNGWGTFSHTAFGQKGMTFIFTQITFIIKLIYL